MENVTEASQIETMNDEDNYEDKELSAMEKAEYLNKNFEHVKKLKKVKSEKFKEALETLEKKGIKFLVECAFNILKGVIILEGPRLVKATFFKPLYERLIDPDKTLDQKRQILLENLDFAKSIVNIIFDHLKDNE